MRRFLWIPICFVTLLIPVVVLASGSDRGFNGVVDGIESRYHVHATRIPFMGLISLVSRKATHEGVANLHIAEFGRFSAEVAGSELNLIVEQRVGGGWERIIRETSRHGGKQTLIFIHPEGQLMGLFVLDKDGSEMDVVQVSVDPDHLDDDIGHYRHHRDDDERGMSE